MFLTRALRRSLAGIGDCVVYAQDPPAARSALQARQGPHQRVALAVHFRISQADEWADKQEIERDGAVYREIRELEREVIPRVDGMVFVSEWARNALLSWLPEAAAVPYAVVTNFVAPHDAPAGGAPLADLVTVGHLEPVKNHRYMLQILAAAKQAGRTVSLDILGDGPLKRDLMQQTQELGLDGQVNFRGFRTDLRDLLPRYKCYAHTSYSESSSLAIIESMAAGLPILAAAIGPIPELCDDGVEARFWPLDDPAQAAAILLELLDDEATRLAAAEAATRRFARDFDAASIAPRLESFLLGLNGEPRGNQFGNVEGPSPVSTPPRLSIGLPVYNGENISRSRSSRCSARRMRTSSWSSPTMRRPTRRSTSVVPTSTAARSTRCRIRTSASTR